MRIGIISSSYPQSPDDSTNAGVFVQDFANKLCDAGVEVVVLTPQKIANPRAVRRFPVKSFPWPGSETSVSYIDPRRPLDLARLGVLVASGTLACLRVFKAERIDHSLAMWAVPSGLFALAARKALGTPYSVWALGSDIWRIGEYPLGKVLLRRIFKEAQHIYADGLLLSSDVERITGRACSFLATSRALPDPNTVDLPDLEAERTHFLCVARFHPHKGVDVLIDAISLIPEAARREMQFHIFGGGPQEEELRAKVRQDRLERYLRIGGYIGRESLAAYLRAVSCLVIPSRIESIPLVLSDAAQAGCPVIATDVGDMGRLVKEYEVGICVPPESPGALAEAILQFHEALRPPNLDGAGELADYLSLDRSVRQVLSDIGWPAASSYGSRAPSSPPR